MQWWTVVDIEASRPAGPWRDPARARCAALRCSAAAADAQSRGLGAYGPVRSATRFALWWRTGPCARGGDAPRRPTGGGARGPPVYAPQAATGLGRVLLRVSIRGRPGPSSAAWLGLTRAGRIRLATVRGSLVSAYGVSFFAGPEPNGPHKAPFPPSFPAGADPRRQRAGGRAGVRREPGGAARPVPLLQHHRVPRPRGTLRSNARYRTRKHTQRLVSQASTRSA
jgi:hypothetical protein